MWYDELPPGRSWAALWSNYILCGTCAGIRPCDGDCPVCGSPLYPNDGPLDGMEIAVEKSPNGHAVTIPVDGERVTLAGERASGAQIKAAAHVRLNFALMGLQSSGTSHVIGDNEVVHFGEYSQFVTIAPTAMGAEGRYEDWIYLQMLEREWKRPVTEADRLPDPDPTRQASPRAAIVVLFWSYFETRVERLLRAGMRDVPARLVEDTLQRYSSIGARLDRLYRVVFDTTYRADLTELGFDDISRHLTEVQERRNAFAHGDPRAIDDLLVRAVVDNLECEHKAWIAVFNRRGIRRA